MNENDSSTFNVVAKVRAEAESLYEQALATAINPEQIEMLIRAHQALMEIRWGNRRGFTIYLDNATLTALNQIEAALRDNTMIGVGLHRDN